MANSILIIDDDVDLLGTLGKAFQRAGWDVYRELCGEAGLRCYAGALPEVVLLDLHLPGMAGLDVLRELQATDSAVIMLTGDEHLPTAVKAMAMGAENFLVKPVDTGHLVAAAVRAAEKVRLRRFNRALAAGMTRSGGAVDDFFGESAAMQVLKREVGIVADSEHRAIAIHGEPGVGKATVARMIHERSGRHDQALIECLADASEQHQLEETLFGVEDHSGGSGSRQGLVELADRGTLLVREITSASLPIQARLAAVLDRGVMRRNSGTTEIAVDIRLLVTTSIEPQLAFEDGLLDPTLWYRVKSSRVAVPPLRGIGTADVAALLDRTLAEVAAELPGTPRQIGEAALERLLAHSWPGNRLELRNVIERAALLARGEAVIHVGHLPGELRARSGPFDRRHTPLTMAEVERMHIERTLKYHQGNRSRASAELGISRGTLLNKIRQYAIPL